MALRAFAISICILFISINFYAQNIKFEQIDISHGLPHNTIYKIFKDRRGLMWFCTGDGLARFDGYSFEVYRPDPDDYEHTIKANIVTGIVEDSKGYLWIGTERGLDRFDPKSQKFEHYYSENNNDTTLFDEISCLTIDEYDKLWIGTPNGLYCHDINNLKDKIFKKVSIKYTNKEQVIVNLKRVQNIIWIGTIKGLLKYNLNNGEKTKMPFSTKNWKNEVIHSIFKTTKNEIIALTNGGLFIYNEAIDDFNKLNITGIDISFGIKCIEEDVSGNLWLGTIDNGVIIIDKNRKFITNLKHDDKVKESINGNAIMAIYKDESEVFWISCTNNCLSKSKSLKNGFNNFFKSSYNGTSLNCNSIWSFYPDEDSILLIGTNEGGLNRFDRKANKFNYFLNNERGNGLVAPFAGTIVKDKLGRIWVGSYSLGITVMIPNKKGGYSFKTINPENTKNYVGWSIRAMLVDSDGQILVGSIDGGLCRIDPITFKSEIIPYYIKSDSKFKDEKVWALYQDKEKYVWLGTNKSGVYRINLATSEYKQFNFDPHNKNSLSSRAVMSIYQDKNEKYWFGTGGGGITSYDAKTGIFKRYNEHNGLSNNTVYGIIEDENGKLWLSTNYGLNKFDPENETFRTYYESDGLQGNEYNIGAYSKSNSGEVFFGSKSGFTSFYPQNIIDDTTTYNIEFTDFKIFNVSQKIKNSHSKATFQNQLNIPLQFIETISLDYNQNVFSIEFTCLDYVSPLSIKYAFQLIGFDNTWRYTSASSREVTYTNLEPGEYTFKVKATNHDGIWGHNEKTLKIIINPPFWKTWWFKFSLVFTFLFSIWLIYNRRIKSIEEQRRKLEIEVENRTKEVVAQKDDIQRKNQQLQIQQQEIVNQAKQLHEHDQMKIRFLTNISHEFRTPLTLILGPIEKLLTRNLPQDVNEQLGLMQRNGFRLLRLINQLLDTSKADSNSLQIYYSKEDLVKFVSDLALSFSSLAQHKKIDFNTFFNIEFCEAYFDKDKLEKIIYNLLSNSFKFTKDGGKIKLSLLLVSKNEEIFNIKIKCEDNGIGIPLDKQDKIFDRFYQVDNMLSRKGEGTGIGLSLVKSIVELLNGSINLKSVPDHGTLFEIDLPIFKNPQFQTTEKNDPETFGYIPVKKIENKEFPNQKRTENKSLENLLLVEDNREMRSFLKSILKDNFNIVEAENGADGLKEVYNLIPDIIISDIMMPEMNGLEFCKKLKSDYKTSHIPIVLLTAKSDNDYQIEGFDLGADDYILKPFSPNVLLARLKNILELRNALKNRYASSTDTSFVEIELNESDAAFLSKIVDIIDANLSNSEFGMEELVKEVGMSRAVLYKKINSLTGMSIGIFIRTIRLKKAAQLLKQGELNVSEVAYETGFNDRVFFSKSFSSFFGVSPKDYQKQSI